MIVAEELPADIPAHVENHYRAIAAEALDASAPRFYGDLSDELTLAGADRANGKHYHSTLSTSWLPHAWTQGPAL